MQDGAVSVIGENHFLLYISDDIPYAMDEKELPLELPQSNNFKSSGTGEGPLANVKEWVFFKPEQKTGYQHNAYTCRCSLVFSSLYGSA